MWEGLNFWADWAPSKRNKGLESLRLAPREDKGSSWICRDLVLLLFPQIITQELISTFLLSTALWGWRMLRGEEKPINYLIRKH